MNGISYNPGLIGAGIENRTQSLTDTDEKIQELAQEFEGVFLSMLTKELRKTVDEGGLFGKETSDSYGGLFDMYMGQHMASAQPLGMASLWANQYDANSDNADNADNSQSTQSFQA